MCEELRGSQHGASRAKGEVGGGGISRGFEATVRSCSLSQRKTLSKRVTDEIFIFTLLGPCDTAVNTK